MAIVARNKYTVSIHRGDCPFESLRPKYGFFMMGDEPKPIELISSLGHYSETFDLSYVYYCANGRYDRVVRSSLIHALQALEGRELGLLLKQLSTFTGVKIVIGTLKGYIELLDPEGSIIGTRMADWKWVPGEAGVAVGEVNSIIDEFLRSNTESDLLEFLDTLIGLSIGPIGHTIEVIQPEIIRRTNTTN